MTAAENGETTGEADPRKGNVAGADHPCQRPGNHRHGRHRVAPGVTLAPVEAVPLDAEHERLALLYLAELLAPLFGSDGSA